MIVLTLNSGSSSAKYQVSDQETGRVLASGQVERIAQDGSRIIHEPSGGEKMVQEEDCPSHREAIGLILHTIAEGDAAVISSISDVKAVGHRVVHGGEKFAQSALVTDETLAAFREIQDLAPLHNPANIMGIEAARAVLPDVPHAAIMDTAWHQTMPARAWLYALPYEWYEQHGVRRYGFHGTSFLYTAKRAAVLLGKDPFDCNLIIAHIGNGSSINAVHNGVSIDTSMGLTPLEGLVMGTRSGDHDPAIVFHMMRTARMSADAVEAALNRKSGILGITGSHIDRRDAKTAADAGDERSRLSIEIEAYRIRKYLGAYSAALGRVDAVVFTAGVGEMGTHIREAATEGLGNLGMVLDPKRNAGSRTRNAETIVSTDESPVKLLVVPTNEELVMTEDTVALVRGSYAEHRKFRYGFQDPGYRNEAREEELSQEIISGRTPEDIIVRPGRFG